MWREMIGFDLSRRVWVSLFMAASNLSAMFWPRLHTPHYLILLTIVLVANLAVCVVVLSGVRPAIDSDEDERVTKFAHRWTRFLGYSSAVLFLVLGVMERLHTQFIPFQIFGYGFLLVISRVLEVSLDKEMDEFRGET